MLKFGEGNQKKIEGGGERIKKIGIIYIPAWSYNMLIIKIIIDKNFESVISSDSTLHEKMTIPYLKTTI